MAKPKVCIALPAYRAERTLAKTIADIPDGIADELILVDDHSPDDTAQLARELGINVYVHPENRRYGGNQKTCYSRALQRGADIVVLLHPDYQYDPKAVPLLIAPILAGHAEMTFGSRFAATGDPIGGGMPWYRYLGNRSTTFLENFFLGSRFTEMHSGLRAYTRRCLLSLPFLSYSNDFAFDSQLLADAVTMGLNVVEIPIITRYTHESSSIAIGPSLRYVFESVRAAAARGRERGRRGSKTPLTLGPPDAVSLDRVSTAPSPTGGDARQEAMARRQRFDLLLDMAAGYWLPGGSLRAVGFDDPQVLETARGRGWTEAPADGRADLVLIDRIQDRSEPAEDLESARRAIDPEGLVVVTGPASLGAPSRRRLPRPGGRSLFTPEGFNARLYAAGLRPVEWKGLGGGTGNGVVVVARSG